MFFMPLRAACFSPQGQRGGCGIKKRGGVAAPHSLNSFVSCVLPLLFGFENDDPKKFEETIATPPKGGFLLTPIAALSGTPLSRPVGGRYRRYLSLREGLEQTPRSGAERREANSSATHQPRTCLQGVRRCEGRAGSLRSQAVLASAARGERHGKRLNGKSPWACSRTQEVAATESVS